MTIDKTNFVSAGVGSVWWEEIGRSDPLVSPGDTITVSSLPARKYLQIRINIINSGQTNSKLTFNGDTTANYSQVVSANFAAGSGNVSISFIDLDNGTPTSPVTAVVNIVNNSTLCKIVQIESLEQDTALASSAPDIYSVIGKWVNTSDQIDRIDVSNQGTGDYAIGSEVVVLGHD